MPTYCLPPLLLLVLLLNAWVADSLSLHRIHEGALDRSFEAQYAGFTAEELPWKGGVFAQRLDHFNALSEETFEQRYFYNDAYWRPGGPFLLYIGGEAQLSPRSVSRGLAVRLARENGAMVVALEHRYYGSSVPALRLTAEGLRYLSSEQALHDLAHFMQQWERAESGARWFTVGGSYPGSLSAWMRLKFPHLVAGSLASSAPVTAKSEFAEYDETIAAGLGAKCAASVRQVFKSLQHKLETGAKNETGKVKSDFGCSAQISSTALMYVLADVVSYVVQYSNPGASYLDQLCSAPFTSTKTSVHDKELHFQDFTTETLFPRLQSTCADFDITNAKYKSIETPEPGSNMRQWMFQSCTEFGYWQVAPRANSLRSEWITEEWHTQNVCTGLFGITRPAPTASTNQNFGAAAMAAKVEGILFTNGFLDPWKALGVKAAYNATDASPSLMIHGAAHCSDLGADTSQDSESLTQARDIISRFVRARLQSPLQTPPERKIHRLDF